MQSRPGEPLHPDVAAWLAVPPTERELMVASDILATLWLDGQQGA